MARRSPLLNVMCGAVMSSAYNLRRDFGEVEQLQVSRKGPADFVSIADKKSEEVIVEELKRARPDFGFLLEEGGEIIGKDTDSRWIIDPLDGTTNFLHGMPHFAISVALEKRGEIVAGVVYNPISDELFWAEKGQGAYLNDVRLRVSSRNKMEDAVLATGIPFKGRCDADGFARFSAQLAEFMPNVAGIRRNGVASLDLAWLAAGRFDGFWEADLQPWDMAAGIVIIQEAGGYVSDLSGGKKMLETGGIIAANDGLHAPMERVIKRIDRGLKITS